MRFKSPTLAVSWLMAVITASLLLVYLWFAQATAPIETDILKLLPKNQQNPVAEQAFERIAETMGNKVIFIVSGDERDNVYQASDALTQQLTQSGYFAQVMGKIPQDTQQQWAKYYFEHRFQFLTEQQRERLNQQPQQQVQQVLQALYNPFAGVTGSELQNDPFLLFRDYLTQLSSLSGQFKVKHNYLSLEKEGHLYVLISAELQDSPYSVAAQRSVSEILQWEAQINQTFGTEIAHTGVLFYADFGTQSAKQEISTIGVVSLLGIVLLILLVFRSVTPLFLSLLSIGVGLLVALTITIAIFGKVHLFSLVFGASLIGVSIDYAFHYLTDRLAAGSRWNATAGLKHIFTAITFGLVTSLIGYLGLLIAPFPGLQQLALFSATGLIAAYLTVVAWYPWLAVKPSADRPLLGLPLYQRWLSAWRNPKLAIGLPVAIAAISFAALTQVHYDDDIRQLQALPASLKSQEAQIAQLTGLQSSQQMLVVTADNDSALIERLEQIAKLLDGWQQQGVLAGYQSLSQYLSSESQQRADYQLVETLYQTQAAQLSQTLGLPSTAVLNQPFVPISLQDYLKASVSEPVRFLALGKVDNKTAAAILLKDLQQPEVAMAFAQQHSDVSYLDKAQEISSLFNQYRVKVMELLVAAMAVIFALLCWRYGFRHSLTMMLPCVIACIAGLAVSVVTGSSLNLFSLLALVLVIGIGIDYTLFFAEQQGSHSTLLAVTLSAITTLLSFGLLALSATHAIHSFGLTVLSGIFVAWLLAPMAIPNQEKTP